MYIIARHLQTIRNPKISHRPAIGKNHAAWQNNEEVCCRRSLKSRDLTEASVILDVRRQKVIKNRLGDNQDFVELQKYFFTHYADYINAWINEQRSR
jgi:hypothetical protein